MGGFWFKDNLKCDRVWLQRRTTGDEPKEVEWPASKVAEGGIVQKELNETVVRSREEIEERLETEDRQKLGDITDEVILFIHYFKYNSEYIYFQKVLIHFGRISVETDELYQTNNKFALDWITRLHVECFYRGLRVLKDWARRRLLKSREINFL